MYGVSAKTKDPVGILNDFDLATWVGYSTTNYDRTGTLPFIAMDLLNGGLDDRVPRLYRHDLESFSWVLAYITVSGIEYSASIEKKTCTIKISHLQGVRAWFTDRTDQEREAHVNSKQVFSTEYGAEIGVFEGHYAYANVIKQITRYWSDLYKSLRDSRPIMEPLRYGMERGRVVRESEPDDPAKSLRSFVKAVGQTLGEGKGQVGFEEVEALLGVIGTPVVTTNTE
jgi:hypothetical protein